MYFGERINGINDDRQELELHGEEARGEPGGLIEGEPAVIESELDSIGDEAQSPGQALGIEARERASDGAGLRDAIIG